MVVFFVFFTEKSKVCNLHHGISTLEHHLDFGERKGFAQGHRERSLIV